MSVSTSDFDHGIIERWRETFNQKVFGVSSFENVMSVVSMRKQNYSKEDIKKIIHVLESTNTDSSHTKKKNDNYYFYKRKFFVSEVESPGEGTQKVLCRKDSSKRICSTDECFDVILDAHVRIGHKATMTTKAVIDETYCNIPRSTISSLISLCPTCVSISSK